MLATAARVSPSVESEVSADVEQAGVVSAGIESDLPVYDRDQDLWEAAQAREEELQATEADSGVSATTEHSADPGSAIEDALERIESDQQTFNENVVDKAERHAAGADRQITSLENQLEQLGEENWIVRTANRASGLTGEVETQLEQEKRVSRERHDHAEKMREALDDSRTKAAEARALLESAKESEARGDSNAAAQQREQAALLTEQAHAAISGEDKRSMNLVTETRRLQELRDSSERLGNTISALDASVTTLEYVDKGAKIVAVSAATVVAGPAGAAAASAVYDEMKTIGTLASEVSMGEKTFAEAGSELAGKQIDIVVDAGIAAGTVYAGGQAGRAVQAAGGGVLRQVGTGAAVGAATSTAGEGVKIAAERGQAEYAFSQQAEGLSGAEREAAHDRFMQERGVSGDQIGDRLAGAAISGAVTGGVSAGTIKVGKLAQGVANESADIGAGATQEYLSTGQVTAGGLIIAAVGSQVGHAAGHSGRPASHAATPDVQGTPQRSDAPEPSAGSTLRQEPAPSEPTQAPAPERQRTWEVNPTNTPPTGLVPEKPITLVELPLDHPDVSVDISKLPPGVSPEAIVVVDPSTVRTSQTGVTRDRTENVVSSMENDGYVAGGDRNTIENAANIVEMPDGAYTSLDNKRIIAAEEAGVPVVARKHAYDEPLSRAERQTYQKQAEFVHVPERRQELMDSGNFEIKTKADGRVYLVPLTWGAAVELRVATASEPNFVVQKPYGSIVERPERREAK